MQNHSQLHGQSCESIQARSGPAVLEGGEDKRSGRQKILKELMDQPHQEKQQIRLSIQRLAQKAVLIVILFGVCALFASADVDKGNILKLFLLASAVILFWPFLKRDS